MRLGPDVRHRSRISAKSTRRRRPAPLAFEPLEGRVVLSVASPTIQPAYLLAGAAVKGAGSSPALFASEITPAMMRSAYGVDQILFGSVAGDGTGETVAIVDAYDQPDIKSDLASFDAQFGLPAPPSFTVLNQTGGSSLPGPDPNHDWGGETSLDVEWVHTIAPGANIDLVEANDASGNLYTAVKTAAALPGVCAVSMSWSSGEFSGETSYDSDFTTPSGHSPVTFLASSDDNGAGAHYPAASPNVVGVGGTTLYVNGDGSYNSEVAWSGSGGGVSLYEAQPSFQNGIVPQSSTNRAVPDIAMDADPSSGVPVVDSYDFGTTSPGQVGGTSLACPMWAGLIAIVDQGRSIDGYANLDGPGQTLPDLYALPSADLHDITTGSNGFPAGPGYDLVTGLGSPVANLLVPALVGKPLPPGTPVITSFSASPSAVTAGTPTTLTATAAENGGTITGVNFYLESDGTPGLELGSDTTLGAGAKAGNSWSISAPTAGLSAGTHTLYAVATDAADNISSVASTTITVTIPAGGGGKPVQGTVAAWDTVGQNGFGTQNLAPSTIASGVSNLTGLTRGPNVATAWTAVNYAWGGDHWAATAASGVASGQYVTFGFTVKPGFSTSLASIAMNYYRNGNGPTSGSWQYSVNGGNWALIGNYGNEFANSGSGSSTYVSLSGIRALQSLPSGTTVNFRVTPYGATDQTGTWYVYDGGGNTNDLVINASGTSQAGLGGAIASNLQPVSTGGGGGLGMDFVGGGPSLPSTGTGTTGASQVGLIFSLDGSTFGNPGNPSTPPSSEVAPAGKPASSVKLIINE